MTEPDDPRAAFIKAACVPRDSWHASGTLDDAESILAAHPELRSSDIHTAAILGDDSAVRRWLLVDPTAATTKGGPYDWDALTHLCFSRYLRLDPKRSDGFLQAATALLDQGASANTGWFEPGHQPGPEWEPVLYGAAGIAHHPELTRLLLAKGADPNDGEVTYHTPESADNGALKALVESGKLTDDSLAIMLLRKSDWHDYEGIKYLLEHGADPNRMTHWGFTGLHQSLRRDNDLKHIEAMLDYRADPHLPAQRDGLSAVELAVRRGRRDVLDAFDRRGIPLRLGGALRLIAACARDDGAAVHSIAQSEPQHLAEVLAQGGTLLAQFAGTANTAGVRQLLDLGVDIAAVHEEGDGYFGIAKNSTALHVATWRAWHETVRFLIARGAPVNALDGRGRTPLTLAIAACVDSYWKYRRSPESVEALVQAGASKTGVKLPTGYSEIDKLLE
jgi:ankyrin repeat protein